MTILRCIPYVLKQVTRHRVRSLLTIAGIAIAMFLFTTVQAMNRGVTEATRATANDTTLVVYREDRYCPATSELPQDYQRRIEEIPAGMDRIFLARGINAQGQIVSLGCVEGITIIPGTDTVVKDTIQLVPVYPAPVIDSIEPTFAGNGDAVEIYGENFSRFTKENLVSFGGVATEVLDAAEGRLRVHVPAKAVSGKVTVRVGRQESAGADFTVLEDEVLFENPYALGMTPDGSRLYVSRLPPPGPNPSTVSVLDTDPASPTYHDILAGEIATTSRYVVEHIRVTPNGKLAYGPAAYETLVIDTDPASRSYQSGIDEFGYPWGGDLFNPYDVEITPDSRRAYISFDETGDIGVFDIDRNGDNFNGLIERISLGDDPKLT